MLVMGLNIYLADDDPDDQELFSNSLEIINAGCQLFVFRDGEVLMNHLNEKNHAIPDMLFLDVNMPRKTGKECLAEIRNNPDLKDIPVIIFTTSGQDTEIAEAYQLGANLFVVKPCMFDPLVNIIRRVLSLYVNRQLFEQTKESFVLSETTI
jgi:CheY-like chemotaxis protein